VTLVVAAKWGDSGNVPLVSCSAEIPGKNGVRVDFPASADCSKCSVNNFSLRCAPRPMRLLGSDRFKREIAKALERRMFPRVWPRMNAADAEKQINVL